MQYPIRVVINSVLILSLALVSTARADLIAHWPGNNNTNELIAGRNGNLVNGAGFDSGQIGQAFRLDGQNDYISVADDPVWTIGTNPFTIALWANFDTIRSGPLGQIPNAFIGHDQGGGTQNKWVFYYAPGTLAFHINGTGSTFLTPPTGLSAVVDKWYHVAITRTGSTYTFYADGASLGTASAGQVIPDPNVPLTFGQVEGLGYFDGRLDDIRIYNEALDASEIARLSRVPEPATVTLLAFGLAALIRRRA